MTCLVANATKLALIARCIHDLGYSELLEYVLQGFWELDEKTRETALLYAESVICDIEVQNEY